MRETDSHQWVDRLVDAHIRFFFHKQIEIEPHSFAENYFVAVFETSEGSSKLRLRKWTIITN